MKSFKLVKKTTLYDGIKLVETEDINSLKRNVKEIAKHFAEHADEFAEDIRNMNFAEVRVILQPQRIPAIIIKTTRPEVKNG